MNKAILGLASVFLLEGCVQTPLGPTVQVLPGRGKPFEQFAQDQAGCNQYAGSQVQGQAQDANNRAVGGAVLGTVLGAGLGAAVGRGYGAGVGAASGAAIGTGLAAGGSAQAQGGIQYQYDNAYASCMVAHGNQLPPPPTYLVQQPGYYVQPAPVYLQPGY